MISDYQIECPQCQYLKASVHREPNSLVARIECPKCHLYRECRLPRPDERLAKSLSEAAKRRISRTTTFEWLARSVLSLIVIGFAFFHYPDSRVGPVLLGMFIILETSPTSRAVEKRLDYVLRLLQHRKMLEGRSAMMDNEPVRNDLLLDSAMVQEIYYEKSEYAGYMYDGYVAWLEASLRAAGCNEGLIDHEVTRFSHLVRDSVKESKAQDVKLQHDSDGGVTTH